MLPELRSQSRRITIVSRGLMVPIAIWLAALLAGCGVTSVERQIGAASGGSSETISDTDLKPQFVLPRIERDVTHVFPLRLPPAIAGKCVALDLDSAVVLMPRELLERLVAARPAGWQNEKERTALYLADRARELLDAIETAKDFQGCASLQKPAPIESLFLVATLLESGSATVIDKKTLMPAEMVSVRFVSGERDGAVMFYVGDKSFLLLPWWVT